MVSIKNRLADIEQRTQNATADKTRAVVEALKNKLIACTDSNKKVLIELILSGLKNEYGQTH